MDAIFNTRFSVLHQFSGAKIFLNFEECMFAVEERLQVKNGLGIHCVLTDPYVGTKLLVVTNWRYQ